MNLKPFLFSLFAIILSAGFSCTDRIPPAPEEIVKNYYEYLNATDFESLSEILDDSLQASEMDLLIASGLNEYYTLFRWDSAFGSHYEISDVETKGNEISLIVAKSNKRIDFLMDTAFISRAIISLESGKITRLATTEYLNLDTLQWSSRRDSLVSWIRDYYPELDGFIFDLSPEGAAKYMDAIDLYNDHLSLLSAPGSE